MSTAVIDNTIDDPRQRPPLILGGNDFTSVTEKVAGLVERPKPPRAWYIAFGISLALAGLLGLMVGYLVL